MAYDLILIVNPAPEVAMYTYVLWQWLLLVLKCLKFADVAAHCVPVFVDDLAILGFKHLGVSGSRCAQAELLSCCRPTRFLTQRSGYERCT